MDPVTVLGVASGVISVLQLTGTVVSQGYSYIATLKDAPRELEVFVQELASLYGVLSVLKGQLEGAQAIPNGNRSSALELLNQPGGPLESCDGILKRVHKRLSKLMSTPKLGNYHVGLFKTKDIGQDMERLERLKSVFQLALHTDQMSLSRAIDDYLRQTLDESQKEQQIIGKHVRNTDSHVEELCRESKLRAAKGDIFEDHLRKTLDKSLREQQILGKHARSTDDNLDQLCRDTKRRLSEEEQIRKKEKSEEIRDGILRQLSGIDYRSNHNAACALQQPGTGIWFTEGRDFKEWQDKAGSVLWLHGIPGAGKTILTSTIIQKMLSGYGNSTNTAITYFYFDFKDHQKQKTIGMLKSILFQLFKNCDTIPGEVIALYEKHKYLSPSIKELRELLKAVSGCFTRCFVILDALDECDERETLLSTLTHLIETGNLQNTRFLFTSRKEHDIEAAFSMHQIHPVSIQDDKVATDVGLYVSESMEKDEKLKKLKENLKKEIVSALVQGERGMFRWVKCQLDTIRDSRTPNAVRKALVSLPQSLDDTYDRILLSIRSDEDRELIRRALQLVIFAARPMTLEEVAEAVVIEEGAESLDEGARLNEPSSLLSICGSLFSLTYGKVGLAHYSVQEYLKSERIRRGPASQFAIQEMSASIEISKVCLTYLGFNDFETGPCCSEFDLRCRSQSFPLLEYAAKEWFHHAKSEFVQENIVEPFARVWSVESNPKFLLWMELWNPIMYDWRKRFYHLKDDRNVSTLYPLVFIGLTNLTRYLLEEGADPDARYYTGFRSSAVIGGDHGVVGKLLQHEAYFNVQDGEYGTALQTASFCGHEKVVEMLLQHGADVNAQGSEYGTAMQAASYRGHEKVVEMLLQHGADVNAQGGMYRTALQAASYRGHEKVVEMLLQHRADVNAQGSEYETALQTASDHGYEKVVEILLQHGADVNAQGSKYGTALRAASYYGHEKVVEMLLQHRADVNAQRGEYGTALQAASYRGHEKVVEMLLQHGADVNARRGMHGTALQAASDRRHEKVVEMLLQHGADVNAQGSEYGTALQTASYRGYEKVVEMLLQHGADVNARRGMYRTALQTASYRGHEKVVEMLLQHGADVNAQGGMYGTALQTASYRGHEKVVEMLLQHGADVNARRGMYGTALQAASDHGYEEAVEMLLKNGANVNSQDM